MSDGGKILTTQTLRGMGLLLVGLVLALSFTVSVWLGATPISFHDAIAAFLAYDPGVMDQVIVRTTRIPRAFIAAAVGASIAIAGAVMQAVTRNPLASPSVLGVNAGATFMVVLAITVLSIRAMTPLVWLAILGAALGAFSVYFLGSLGREGLTPLKIVLAGAAMSALFGSLTQGLLVHNENGLNDVLFWLTGSIAGRSMEMLLVVLPYMACSWVVAWLLARQLNIMSMGEEQAQGLGQRTSRVKWIAGGVVVLAAGGAVAVAGPIGFIGIVIPHIARFIVGNDHRWLILYCGGLGAALLLIADTVARFLIMPEEVPVGVMTAIIGAPFFIYLARRGRGGA